MRACLDGLVKRQGSAGAPTRWSSACVVKAEVRDAGLPGRPGQEAGVQHSLVARLHGQGRGERKPGEFLCVIEEGRHHPRIQDPGAFPYI